MPVALALAAIAAVVTILIWAQAKADDRAFRRQLDHERRLVEAKWGPIQTWPGPRRYIVHADDTVEEVTVP